MYVVSLLASILSLQKLPSTTSPGLDYVHGRRDERGREPCCDGRSEVTGDPVGHQLALDQSILHSVVHHDLAHVDDARARNVRIRA